MTFSYQFAVYGSTGGQLHTRSVAQWGSRFVVDADVDLYDGRTAALGLLIVIRNFACLFVTRRLTLFRALFSWSIRALSFFHASLRSFAFCDHCSDSCCERNSIFSETENIRKTNLTPKELKLPAITDSACSNFLTVPLFSKSVKSKMLS